MKLLIHVCIFLAITTILLATTSDAAVNIRGSNIQPKDARALAQDDSFFDEVVAEFIPDLKTSIEDSVADLDPISIGQPMTMNLGSTHVSDTCNASASIVFSGLTISGVSALNVTSFKVEPGSEDLDLQLSGLTFESATFSGIWQFNATVPSVVADVDAAFSTSLCGVPVVQNVTTSVSIVNPKISVRIEMKAEVSDLSSLQVSRQSITTTTNEEEAYKILGADILGVHFEYDSLDTEVGLSGTLGSSMMEFNTTMVDGLNEALEPVLMELLEGVVTEQIFLIPAE